MNITLRKANALQQSIQDAIKQIEITGKIDLNEFEDPAERLNAANEQLMANDRQRVDLTNVLYEIRTLIGIKNAEVGINNQLSYAACIDKRLSQLAIFFSPSSLQDSLTVITGKVQKLKDQDNRGFGYGNNTVTTGILTTEQLETFKNEQLQLKKEKQQINDGILELNVRSEIVLNDNMVEILTANRLL